MRGDWIIQFIFWGFVILFAMVIADESCHARYAETYSPVSWRPIGGCMVTVNGRLVYAGNVREQAND